MKSRGLVSAGATSACAPAEILQGVRGTRPKTVRDPLKAFVQVKIVGFVLINL